MDNTGPSILEFNIDGSNGFAIAGNTDNSAVFSPSVAGNGTTAFTANTDLDGTYLGYPHIFLMNADGTEVRNISSSLPNNSSSNCCFDLSPAISPDGTTVAFLAALNAAPNGSLQQEIYLVNADGSKLRQLTPFMANPGGDYSQSAMYALAWSPDSTQVAFRGSVYTSQCGTYGNEPIFVNVIGTINADGSGMRFLACDNGDGYVSSLDWSPDGTLLVWGRNVSHGAQGCSGCVGEPAIAFHDFSGRNRYPNGITSGALGTDSCPGGPHCIHFSPDSTRLAYVDAYPNNGNPCQSSCNVSFINLDGSGQANSAIPTGGHTVWWEPGTTIPSPAQITVAGPNGPGSTVEVWPGFSQQVTPSLSDSTGNLILHTAQNYSFTSLKYGTYGCLSMGPFGLAVYHFTDGQNAYGRIYATNAGFTSNTIDFNCWTSPPCSYNLTATTETIGPAGGPDMVGVIANLNPGITGSACPWTAASNASWITITSDPNGAGSGNVSFTVAVNTGPARQGTMTIAGTAFTVSQIAAGTGQAPAITSSDRTTFQVGVMGSFTVTTAGTPPPKLTESGTLPAGVAFTDLGNGTGSLSGMPAAGSGGTYTFSFTAGNGVNPDATQMFILTVNQPAGPQPNQGGVVSAADGTFSTAAGGIASLYGTNLATGTFVASNLPLPAMLDPIANTRVNVSSVGAAVSPASAGAAAAANGPVAAPLFFVSQYQINFQVPWEFLGQPQVSVSVTAFGVTSAPVTVNLVSPSPVIFTINQQGTGQGAIQHANSATFAAPADSIPGAQARPAAVGDFLTIYCTGLGDVSHRPADGAAASSSPLEETMLAPSVTIGGVNAPVSFSGLAPGFVSLYQVNAQVPAGAPAGNAVPVIVEANGAASNAVTIAVQ